MGGVVGGGRLGPEQLKDRRLVALALHLELGLVAQPLRAALTGRASSPGIFDVLVLLGREESLARIAEQMSNEG